jgi:hypothetical protein
MSSRSLMHHVFLPSKPPDGGYPPSFRLIIGGTQLRGSWYLSAIVRLQGFSSASPAAPPRRGSPKTVTTSPWVGRSKLGCDLGPTLSFKDVHHPRWGGGRAEPELYLPRGFVGHPLLRCSRDRVLAGPAGGSDFYNAGLADGGRRQPQRVGLVGLAPGAPSCRKAAAAPCAREDRPRCRALLGRRSCSGAVLPLHRYGAFARGVGALLVREDPSGDLPAGRRPLSSVPRRRRLEKSPSPTGSPPPSALRASGPLYLSWPLERRRGRGQGCSGVRPEAITAAVRPPVEGVVVAAAGAGDGEPSVGLLLLRRPPHRVGLFVPVEVELEFRL